MRTILPTWFVHLAEGFSYKEVQFIQMVLPPVKNSCPHLFVLFTQTAKDITPAENDDEEEDDEEEAVDMEGITSF